MAARFRYEKEYTPLIPEDVENEPPIERPVKDAYLESRVARFYAEIAQYQPGVDRAAYELKLLQLGDGLLPAPMEKCAPRCSRRTPHASRLLRGLHHDCVVPADARAAPAVWRCLEERSVVRLRPACYSCSTVV